jgi:hypothetical protein
MTEESLEQQKNRLLSQATTNASVSAAINTFNAITASGILAPPQLVSTVRTRFDASTNA